MLTSRSDFEDYEAECFGSLDLDLDSRDSRVLKLSTR